MLLLNLKFILVLTFSLILVVDGFRLMASNVGIYPASYFSIQKPKFLKGKQKKVHTGSQINWVDDMFILVNRLFRSNTWLRFIVSPPSCYTSG